MLRFVFGASGAGKSTGLYGEIIDRSIKDPGTNFLIIVPDQFTMQTQKDVVRMHPSNAIMNIDILSFGRLSHRIFEETGHGSFSVLDDVGKSLVLRHVAEQLGDRLPVIGSNMRLSGYIDEVKSTISEFMQYGIGDEELLMLEEATARKRALSAKIRDLRLLYSEFLKYIKNDFVTSEETLDILCEALPKSHLIRDSVIFFDGFTGFTPIQYRVIKVLLELCREVTFAVTIGSGEDPFSSEIREQELFALSKKTVRDLERLEFEVQKADGAAIADFETFRNIRHSEGKENGDIFITSDPSVRLKNNPELSFLEKNLFRYKTATYEGKVENISIFEASSPSEEIRQTMIKISRLVKDEGYAYRDIALVCGSMETYGELISRYSAKFGIPVYLDKNTDLMLNPIIEYITSALNIVISGYRYDDVFHYVKSGMTGFSRDDADILENYVRALGIKGRRQWEDRFLRRMPARFTGKRNTEKAGEKELLRLQRLDEIRSRISSDLKPLFDAKSGTASQLTQALIQMIKDNDCEGKLSVYRDMFADKGDAKKVREYEQVYDRIMELLTQVNALIGSEKIDIREYKDILTAGFSEVSIGTIPQDVDRILVGDIERTRLKEVKCLFFVGVNDGNIPAKAGGLGILSEIDRQFLLDLQTSFYLAPTPREQMYIQRLYLYMNLTKPTDSLWLSYSKLGSDGKSMQCAYLIPKLQQMYENLQIERPEDDGFESQIESVHDSRDLLATMMQDYAQGRLAEGDVTKLMTLCRAVSSAQEGDFLDRMIAAAFMHYNSVPLAKEVALSLYGASLFNSVSRLEKYAGCAYAHFIQYGLRLSERLEYDFKVSDLGNVFHEVLEKYTAEIISKGIEWRNLSQEDSDRILNKALTECFDSYGETILRSSARNTFLTERITRILRRTVDTLKYQMSKGVFNPAYVEMEFDKAGSIDEIDISLSDAEKDRIERRMKLQGRIDRVDLFEDQEHVYVKVMDFKSGTHKFNIAALYYGLQLQLVMYMNVAVAVEKKVSAGKDVVPAAILYYHVDDPLIDAKSELEEGDINRKIKNELKMTGLVNDNPDVIRMLDGEITKASDIIPVEFKKDGSLGARSQTASTTEYRAISDFAGKMIRDFGKNILDGDISVNPYEMGGTSACKYCAYRSICGYDERIKGFGKRKLDISDDEAMARILSEGSKDD